METTLPRDGRGHNPDIGAAAFPTSHVPQVINGQTGVIRDQFQIEHIAAFCHAESCSMHMLHFLSEDGRPLGNQKGICQLYIKEPGLDVGFNRTSDGLLSHANWMRRHARHDARTGAADSISYEPFIVAYLVIGDLKCVGIFVITAVEKLWP